MFTRSSLTIILFTISISAFSQDMKVAQQSYGLLGGRYTTLSNTYDWAAQWQFWDVELQLSESNCHLADRPLSSKPNPKFTGAKVIASQSQLYYLVCRVNFEIQIGEIYDHGAKFLDFQNNFPLGQDDVVQADVENFDIANGFKDVYVNVGVMTKKDESTAREAIRAALKNNQVILKASARTMVCQMNNKNLSGFKACEDFSVGKGDVASLYRALTNPQQQWELERLRQRR